MLQLACFQTLATSEYLFDSLVCLQTVVKFNQNSVQVLLLSLILHEVSSLKSFPHGRVTRVKLQCAIISRDNNMDPFITIFQSKIRPYIHFAPPRWPLRCSLLWKTAVSILHEAHGVGTDEWMTLWLYLKQKSISSLSWLLEVFIVKFLNTSDKNHNYKGQTWIVTREYCWVVSTWLALGKPIYYWSIQVVISVSHGQLMEAVSKTVGAGLCQPKFKICIACLIHLQMFVKIKRTSVEMMNIRLRIKAQLSVNMGSNLVPDQIWSIHVVLSHMHVHCCSCFTCMKSVINLRIH